jgi:hypothetical protein
MQARAGNASPLRKLAWNALKNKSKIFRVVWLDRIFHAKSGQILPPWAEAAAQKRGFRICAKTSASARIT